jgi:hypothetical protein
VETRSTIAIKLHNFMDVPKKSFGVERESKGNAKRGLGTK